MQANSVTDVMNFQCKNDVADVNYEYNNKSNKSLEILTIEYESMHDDVDYEYSKYDYPSFDETTIIIDEDYTEYYINNNSKNDDNDILDLKDIYV